MSKGFILSLATLGLIGLAAAADEDLLCPVEYVDLGNPQMRMADVTVDVDKSWGAKGWQLMLTFDKSVKEAKSAGVKREDTKMVSPSKYMFRNRGYNGLLKGGEVLKLTFQVNEKSEVKKGQKYAEIKSVKIRSTSGADNSWLELCQPIVMMAPTPATPPPPPPCSDFYVIEDINDSRDGGRCSRQYKGHLDITFPKPVVGFKFDMTMSGKINNVLPDNIQVIPKPGKRTFTMKPWDNTAQIKYHKGESVAKWDHDRANFGTFQVQYDELCNPKYGQKVTEDMLPRPSKIVVYAKGIEHLMCQG